MIILDIIDLTKLIRESKFAKIGITAIYWACIAILINRPIVPTHMIYTVVNFYARIGYDPMINSLTTGY